MPLKVLSERAKQYGAKVVVFNEVIYKNDDRRKKSRTPGPKPSR
jgi:hypothetical protein